MSIYDGAKVNWMEWDEAVSFPRHDIVERYNNMNKILGMKPWPIDPNAPKNTIQDWVNQGYKVVVTGGLPEVRMPHNPHEGAMVVRIGGKYHDFMESGVDEAIARLKARAGRVGPTIPIVPIEELKINIERASLSEEEFFPKHKVTPREQKNRERYMKKRRK